MEQSVPKTFPRNVEMLLGLPRLFLLGFGESMSKRFTETRCWDDPWYQDLPPNYKLFWKYLCDRCGLAGDWPVNMKLASYQTGATLKAAEAITLFNVGKERVRDCGGVWLIVDFVHFQYGELHTTVPFHRRIQEEMTRLAARVAARLPARGREEEEREEEEEDKEGEGEREEDREGGKRPPDSEIVQRVGRWAPSVIDVLDCRPEFSRIQPEDVAEILSKASDAGRPWETYLHEFVADTANRLDVINNPLGLLRKYLQNERPQQWGNRKIVSVFDKPEEP